MLPFSLLLWTFLILFYYISTFFKRGWSKLTYVPTSKYPSSNINTSMIYTFLSEYIALLFIIILFCLSVKILVHSFVLFKYFRPRVWGGFFTSELKIKKRSHVRYHQSVSRNWLQLWFFLLVAVLSLTALPYLLSLPLTRTSQCTPNQGYVFNRRTIKQFQNARCNLPVQQILLFICYSI